MRLLYGHNEAVAEFVAGLIPRCRNGFGKCVAIGVLNAEGALVAGMVFNNYDPDSGVIEFSGASVDPRWLTRPVLRALFAYPFEQLGCQMVLTRNAAENVRLHRQLRAYGFESLRIPRLFGRDRDAMVWTLTEESWRTNRFNRREGGIEQARSAEAA